MFCQRILWGSRWGYDRASQWNLSTKDRVRSGLTCKMALWHIWLNSSHIISTHHKLLFLIVLMTPPPPNMMMICHTPSTGSDDMWTARAGYGLVYHLHRRRHSHSLGSHQLWKDDFHWNWIGSDTHCNALGQSQGHMLVIATHVSSSKMLALNGLLISLFF